MVMGVRAGVHTHTHSKNSIYLIKYTLSISRGKALDEWCRKGHCNSVFRRINTGIGGMVRQVKALAIALA